ncbi:MAG: hypothetical protein ACW99A_05960 [Candidatus Kariarchaeaceae archaeon]
MTETDIKIDMGSSYDFIAQVYNEVTPEMLYKIGKKLEIKSNFFNQILLNTDFSKLSVDDLKSIIKSIFSLRKVSKKWTDENYQDLIPQIKELFQSEDNLNFRFNQFCQYLQSNLEVKRPFDFTSELLCFADPDKYWLWCTWMFDPKAVTGSLTLVLEDGTMLEQPTFGNQYEIIGDAIKSIDEIANQIGIREPNIPQTSKFETIVFLCAVYSVYMYTVMRMRMTKEFNTILPNMIELIHRLLRISPKDLKRYEGK